MIIGQGWARLGFGRSSSADFYIRGAMAAAGVEIEILGGATALTAAATAILATALTF